MKNSACSGRTRPQGPITIAVVRRLALPHGGEVSEGAGFPPVLVPHVQPSRRLRCLPVLGSSSNRSDHGQSTTTYSCTQTPLSVLDLTKVPRTVSSSQERARRCLSRRQHSPPNLVLRPRCMTQRVRVRIVNLFSPCPCLRVDASPKPPRALPRLLRYPRSHPHPRVLQNK